MKARALNDYVQVKVASVETVSKGGIILPNNDKRLYEGEVVSFGDDKKIIEVGLKVGDYVIYPEGFNSEVMIDDVLYDFVSIYNIECIREDEND